MSVHRLPLLALLSGAFIASFRRDDEKRAALAGMRPIVMSPSYVFGRWQRGR